MAEIFRPATAGVESDPLEGSFAFHVPAEGRVPALDGMVELMHSEDGYRGLIGAPGLGWARIVWGRDEPGGTHLIATAPVGLLNVWLDEGPDGSITGRFMGPGPTRELTGRRTER